MTKKELIKFLEPFTDEIQIVYEDYENGTQNLNPRYIMNKNIRLEKEFNIDVNEGYIEL